MIRELIGGKVMLTAEADGSLWGNYNPNPAALFQPQGQRGSGGGFDLYIQHEQALPIVPRVSDAACKTTNRPCNHSNSP
jgi:hypothetical protein